MGERIHTLLVRMQISTASVENDTEIHHNNKNRTTVRSSNPTPRYIASSNQSTQQTNLCTLMFIAAFIHSSQDTESTKVYINR